MFTDKMSVDKHPGVPVASLKMQQQPFVTFDGCEGSGIPYATMWIWVFNAAHLRFICKRNLNLVLWYKTVLPPKCQSVSGFIKSKIPSSIEVFPLVAEQLWAGVIFYIIIHDVRLLFVLNASFIICVSDKNVNGFPVKKCGIWQGR